jgi:multisubunit Na+/H+ antiporter MnhB subunit
MATRRAGRKSVTGKSTGKTRSAAFDVPRPPQESHCSMKHGVPGLALVVFLFAALALIFIPVFDWLSQQFINSSLPELLGIRTWVSAYFITVGYCFFALGLVLALVLSAVFGRLLQGRHRD